MLARTSLWYLGVFFVTFALGLVRCRVDDALDDRLWRCEDDRDCGEKDGRQMACWSGYCMPSCEPSEPPPLDHKCLDVGVLVRECTPLMPDSSDDCSGELSCFRTDLVLNEGICVPFRVCSRSEECRPGDKANTCATEVLETFYGGSDVAGEAGAGGGPSIGPRFDHLLCLQDECIGSGCANGEFCLPEEYGNTENYPPICVPRCDPNEHCPPDYACAKTDLTPGAKKLCIPGVPGVRCTNEEDCAVGHCTDIGVSFKVCTDECDNDEQCERFSTPPHFFRCLSATPDGPKYCVSTTSLTGFKCATSSDCPADTPLCTSFSPAEANQPHPECRPRCHENGTCDPRAGVPHVCLDQLSILDPGEQGGCYPATFGVPCSESSECLRPMTCESITLDGFEFLRASKICTLPCRSDDACRADPEHPKSVARPYAGYCGPDGFCRVPIHDDQPCAEARQCFSGVCTLDRLDPSGTRRICGKD